jgi:hypothetical protein
MARHAVNAYECLAKGSVWDWSFGGDVSQTGAQPPSVGAGEEEGHAEPEICQAVAVARGLAEDQPVQAEAAQRMGHLAGGDVAGNFAQQRSEALRCPQSPGRTSRRRPA